MDQAAAGQHQCSNSSWISYKKTYKVTVITCCHHESTFNHLQFKRRLLLFPFSVIIMIAPVLSQYSCPFIGCQAWRHTLQELLTLRITGLKQQAAVCCDDGPASNVHVNFQFCAMQTQHKDGVIPHTGRILLRNTCWQTPLHRIPAHTTHVQQLTVTDQ